MTVARGRPQPPAASAVMAELQAGFCQHDGVPGRCPMCRADSEPDLPDGSVSPGPRRPTELAASGGGGEDDQDPLIEELPLLLAMAEAAVRTYVADHHVEDDSAPDPRSVDWWQW
jgi:hypothetical protein